MSKKIDFFYRMEGESKVPYIWKKGEKEEYFLICSLVEGWGGFPLDVDWAKSTNSYKEAFQKHFKK